MYGYTAPNKVIVVNYRCGPRYSTAPLGCHVSKQGMHRQQIILVSGTGNQSVSIQVALLVLKTKTKLLIAYTMSRDLI